jgi:DNA-binding protein H-NS
MAENTDNPSKRKGAIDLDAMTAQELNALIEQAEAKRAEKQDEARSALIEEFRGKAAELGLELGALLPGGSGSAPAATARRTRRDAGGTVPVRFRGPGGETWSGRGRMPKWLSAMEASGRKREEFRI